jgi:aryl-alcohol dehydrogenase-like predicted oxidoreductase
MAIAFALLNKRVASVLFGATTPEQVIENATAVDVAAALDADAVAELRGLATTST